MRTVRGILLLMAVLTPACGGGSKNPDIYPPITTATPGGGSYGAPLTVVLVADDTQNPVPYGMNYPPKIYYSTDGVDPAVGAPNTTSGPSPLGGIAIPSGTTVLKFFAIDTVGNVEAVHTETSIVP